ncbi:ABC transporter permease [Spirillospora sp. NPDC047279]|uniref:ABC transporter permease n=1 Tax=Spirillospora sp. NPDC047279 TaxID=3155478 RepID=UPI0033C555F2
MTGSGVLLRFLLRRERRGLVWWLLGATVLFGYQSAGSQSLYSTPEDLAKLRQTMGGNTAIVAMSGPTELLDTIGGEVVFEIFGYLAIVVALMNMFLVGRNTRSDEETGRAELIRSARVGRHAPLIAALCLAGLADVAVGTLVFAAGVGTGLPVGGSVLVGAAIAALGLVYATLTAALVQVFQSTRGVYGAVALALGVSYMLRAAGDVGGGALSWASPIGWGQRTFPYSDNRWWPLLLSIAATVITLLAALALLDRRDFGAGLLPARPGRATAGWSLGSPYGLAWRLQRGALAGWTAGAFLLAAAYGSFVDSVQDFATDNPEIADYLGGSANVVDSFLALTLAIMALLAAAFGITGVVRMRAEETSGRAEPVLATPTSRGAWLASHLLVALGGSALMMAVAGFGEGLAYAFSVSDPAQIPRLTAVALVHVPAIWLLVGLAALGLGWLPRFTAPIAWTAFGYCAVIAVFAGSTDLPEWAQSLSPFTHIPEVPLETFSATPLLTIGIVATVLLIGGYVGLRRRDLGY